MITIVLLVWRLFQEVQGCASELPSWSGRLCRDNLEHLPCLSLLPGYLGLRAIQLVYRVAFVCLSVFLTCAECRPAALSLTISEYVFLLPTQPWPWRGHPMHVFTQRCCRLLYLWSAMSLPVPEVSSHGPQPFRSFFLGPQISPFMVSLKHL